MANHLNRLGLAFLVWSVGGVVGILVDLDHLVEPLARGQWPTLENLGGRDLHFEALLVSGFILCGSLTHLVGLFWSRIMRRE